MELTPGAVIAGRYRVEQKVGAGGMGEVWAGEHLTVGSKVALKTLLPAAACNHEIIARFRREAYILGKIRSDHVARVVDFIEDEGFGLVLVMEFVDGEALTRTLVDRALTVEEAIDLGVDVASALADLHRVHIVHRDLKPGNIMLQPLPDGHRRAVVVDFGVSRLNAAEDEEEDEEITGITRADMAVGTIEYMAPEQVLNSRGVTGVADIYATGAILYRAAAGRHIFDTATDAELARKKLMTDPPALALTRSDALAQAFAAVVARAIKRRPSERWQTAEELLAALLPLRELARAAGDFGEATTAVDQKVPAEVAAAGRDALAASSGSRPIAPASADAPTRTEETPMALRAAATPPAIRAARSARRGVPAGVLVGTVLGVAVGALMAALVGKAPRPATTPAAPAAIEADAAAPATLGAAQR